METRAPSCGVSVPHGRAPDSLSAPEMPGEVLGPVSFDIDELGCPRFFVLGSRIRGGGARERRPSVGSQVSFRITGDEFQVARHSTGR